jgi:FixJ family two-component response regulator
MATSRPLIAVVDDEESIRKALNRLMRSAGLNVETFASGAEFLASVATHRPDCVVLDLHMPHPNGFEVQSQLLRLTPPLPVVVITGQDSSEARERAMASNPSAYLRKPIDEKVLLDAVAAAIDEGSQ